MRPQLPEDLLVALLRQCYSAPKCRFAIERRPVHLHHYIRTLRTSTRQAQQYGTSPELSTLKAQDSWPSSLKDGFALAQSSNLSTTAPETTNTSEHGPEKIAILGGGITGLATAYYLTKYLPNAYITLYEASDRMGGWLQSKHVNVGNGRIVFEQGPRNIRPGTPAGLLTLELIKAIGLEDEIITTSKQSAAAQSRFVYYPDHLVQMPGPGQNFFTILWRLVTDPMFQGIFSGLAVDSNKPRRPSHLEDESVGSFLRRRLGNTHVGDNLVSAILHGVYAGDVNQLSVKSLLPVAWHIEGRYGSLFAGMKRYLFDGLREMKVHDLQLIGDMRTSDLAGGLKVTNASVYSFKQGIGALSDGLMAALKSNHKVRLKKGVKVKKVTLNGESNRVEISRSLNSPPKAYNRVISTISGRTLSQLTSPGSELPSLSKTHAVTVMVVNLYYSNPALLPVRGFGYLIPRSVPWAQNPERALGVVFDSDANVGQDTVPGTKVTVMLGGHWWDDWDSYPDEAEGAAMAKAVLKRHLKIEEKPVVVNVGLQRECIPQYTVGHEARMKKAHSELVKGFKGKLAVAGNSFTGVGLNDCVRGARDLADMISRQGKKGVTGLEQFTTEVQWISVPARGPVRSAN